MLLQPTSPLRLLSHLAEARELFEKFREEADTLVSVSEAPHSISGSGIYSTGNEPIIVKGQSQISNRQGKPKYYCRNGPSIYLGKISYILEASSLYSEAIIPYIMEKKFSFEIDDAIDFKVVEALYKT